MYGRTHGQLTWGRTQLLSSGWPPVTPRRSVRVTCQAHAVRPENLMAYNRFSCHLALCRLLVSGERHTATFAVGPESLSSNGTGMNRAVEPSRLNS